MFNVCGIIVTCILGMNSNTCYDKGDEQSMKIVLNLKNSDEMDFEIWCHWKIKTIKTK